MTRIGVTGAPKHLIPNAVACLMDSHLTQQYEQAEAAV
jgi:hypothetical protein